VERHQRDREARKDHQNIAENDRTWKMITVSISTIMRETPLKVPCSPFRLFYVAARLDPVALGQSCDDRLNGLLNLYRDLRRLK